MTAKIVLIGTGRVGPAMARRLHVAGYPIQAIISRDISRAEEAARFVGCSLGTATTDLHQAREGDVVLIALPDDQVSPMAQRLQREVDLSADVTLVHFSGLKTADSMAVVGSSATLISIHPLLSFADRSVAAERLDQCPCALEGDEEGLALAEELVKAVGGKSFLIESHAKAIYHAAACISSNYLVTLTACARDLMSRCGFDRQQAMDLLRPLLEATSANLSCFQPEDALTGPIVRGDLGTVEQHINALEEQAPELLDLYRSLGGQTVKLAAESGRLDEKHAAGLQRLLFRTER